MEKPKVLVAEFQHETNCFSPLIAGVNEFKARVYKDASEVVPFYKGTKTVIGGFIEASISEGFELMPALAAFAEPSGLVTTDMFKLVSDKIIQAIKSNKEISGILLCLHGAMVYESGLDAEGDILEAIRNTVGPEMPIITTLDLHGNLTGKMVRNATAFFSYETYPHVDGFERGYEAGRYMAEVIRTKIKPVMSLKHVPILAHLIETASEPHISLLNEIHKWEAKPHVINVAVMHGFAWSDVPDATVSTFAVTDGDAPLAEDITTDMAMKIWERRHQFQKKLLSPREAVKEALAFPDGPVIIADSADNPGGGGLGDSTFILKELLEAGAGNVAFALIPDQESVNRAIISGIGTKVKLDLGGKMGSEKVTGGSIPVEVVVRTIFDGLYVNKGPMETGVRVNLGRSVVVEVDGIEIIVTERRRQPWDAEILRRVGIEPADKKIIVLKSSVHFRGSFGTIAKKILNVDTPACVTMNFSALHFKHIQRPVYPLDRDFDFSLL